MSTKEQLKPYKCHACGERFLDHVQLYAHQILEHDFKPTMFSHTARYWRFSNKPQEFCPHCGEEIIK